MSRDRRFDDVLMTMAGQAGSLEALLSIFFSFLHRQTDFYVTFDPSKTGRASMGFPAGAAEKLLLRAFRAFPYKPYSGSNSSSPTNTKSGTATTKVSAANKLKPSAAAAAGLAATQSTHNSTRDKSSTANTTQKASTTAAANRTTSSAASKVVLPPESPPSISAAAVGAKTAAAEGQQADKRISLELSPDATDDQESNVAEKEPVAPEAVQVRYTENGKQIPIGNGGVTARYYWTQTVSEATVYVDVPAGTRSKDITCTIEPRRLRLKIKCAQTYDVVIDGELPSAVSREDSMWSLNDGNAVVISLEKTKRTWWGSVVEGDPEIDTSKVDSTARIGEFDEETQGTIRKIMFDQRQKAQGLPTSDHLSAEAVLERAKGLPGSPFLPEGT